MITAIIAAAAALMPQPVAREPQPLLPDARPALWVVNDHDTVIYLFGTFHALDGRSAWFNDEVKTAFTASNELILETIIPEPLPISAPAPQPEQMGPQPLDPLGPVPPFAGSSTFLSTSKMVMKAGRSQGMSIDHGADSILLQAAERTGKPVSGLESFQYQIGMFSRIPATIPPANEKQAAAMSAALAAILSELQAAWNRGETERFAPMLEDMRMRSPETYRLLFDERNMRWAAWIAGRLEQPGTVFVAVGAGHLAGRDSVQRKLAMVGVRSARIN